MYTAPSIYKMGKHACIPVKLLQQKGGVKKRKSPKKRVTKVGRKTASTRRKTGKTVRKVHKKTTKKTTTRKRRTKI